MLWIYRHGAYMNSHLMMELHESWHVDFVFENSSNL